MSTHLPWNPGNVAPWSEIQRWMDGVQERTGIDLSKGSSEVLVQLQWLARNAFRRLPTDGTCALQDLVSMKNAGFDPMSVATEQDRRWVDDYQAAVRGMNRALPL